MKRRSAGQSTTNTPSPRIFKMGASGVIVPLASATAVTLPVAPVVLRHQSIGLVLLVGLFPALPLVLTTVVLLSVYTVASLLAIIVGAVRIAFMRVDPTECLNDLFALVANAPIALITRTPLKQAKRVAKGSGQKHVSPQMHVEESRSVNPGPPSYEQLFREWPELFEWIARGPGRHARQEVADSAQFTEEHEIPKAA